MKIRTINLSYETRVRMFWTLATGALVSLTIYIYCVLAIVHHTVAKEALVEENLALSGRVSELEYANIALKNGVSLSTALEHGFSEVTSPIYVSRSRSSLTLNTLSR